MKILLKCLFLLFFLSIISECVEAQDIIVKANNDSLKVKIVQITLDKIKFRYHGIKSGQLLEIPKTK
ncbi:MAG: hypothetical protein IPN88_10495 [Bacteroidetes bacterium]|nr:hypothetical protein [Bacteroidota bacterium]